MLVRAIRASDINDIAAIYATEAVIANTGQVPYRDAAFWQNFYKTRDPQAVELIAELDGRAIGHLGMILNASPRRKHVASFGIAIHPDFHGRGAGSALVGEMVRLGDNWLNLLRIELMVASDNVRAVGLYRKHGFELEGEARFDNFRNGKFSSSLHMARLNPNWAGVTI